MGPLLHGGCPNHSQEGQLPGSEGRRRTGPQQQDRLNRIHGTPAGFDNCHDGGCVRCRDRYLGEIGRAEEASDPELAEGKAKHLDLCVCVHAEANAILSGARFGNRTEGAVLYTTHAPCFTCLKEAIQAGIKRIVYLRPYSPSESPSLKQQYELLAEHLRGTEQRNFEQLEPQGKLIDGTGTEPREPNLDMQIEKILEETAQKQVAESEARPMPEATSAPAESQESGRSSAPRRSSH